MVILALALAVVVTYIVWIRRPEQRMMSHLSAELRLSHAFVKPGEAMTLTVTVTNDKMQAVPLLRVDVNLPQELIFADGDQARLRQYSRMCTIGAKETLTFTYSVIAQSEGKVVVETPELIVYGMFGAVIANNVDERGKPAARLCIRRSMDE